MLGLAAGYAGQLHVHKEHGDVLGAFLAGIGLGVDHRVIREGRAGNEGLAAVENKFVPSLHGGGQGPARVGAGARFGQGEDQDLFSLGHGDHVVPLLLLGAAVEQRTRPQGVGGVGIDGQHRGHPGELLHHHGIGQTVAALAAVFHRDLDAQKAAARHLIMNGAVKFPGLLQPVQQLVRELRFRKLPEKFAHHLLLFGQYHFVSLLMLGSIGPGRPSVPGK